MAIKDRAERKGGREDLEALELGAAHTHRAQNANHLVHKSDVKYGSRQLDMAKVAGAFVAVALAGQAAEISRNGAHPLIAKAVRLRPPVFKGLIMLHLAHRHALLHG